VQRVTVFSAAAAAGSTNPNGGRALIAFLSSPAASAAIAKSGMDPVTPPSVAILSLEQLLERFAVCGEEEPIFVSAGGVLGRDDVQQTRDGDLDVFTLAKCSLNARSIRQTQLLSLPD
jgi:ABC-type Fe3+ transport system substrate-binding protein